MEREEAERTLLAAYARREAVTLDGFRIELAANIGTVEEASSLLSQGAEAVGLYRTEFLFMEQSRMPDEETQYRAYKAVAESMQGRPVVIRTLDIGGDKELPYLDLPKEMNPFLGYRAIRLCLDRKESASYPAESHPESRGPRHGEDHVPDDFRTPGMASSQVRV